MVKAAAYGAGSYEIAKTLQEHHVDYLVVAVADEGSELRKAGITSLHYHHGPRTDIVQNDVRL